jgi:hypothetical protein
MDLKAANRSRESGNTSLSVFSNRRKHRTGFCPERTRKQYKEERRRAEKQNVKSGI